MNTLQLTQPDDWHLHLRDGAVLRDTVGHSARQFGRAIVMPNLSPPITTVAQAAAYRERILAARPAGSEFEPLMSLYLTDATAIAEIVQAAASPFVHGAKLYPAGATTNSASGVTAVERIDGVLAAMAEHSLILQVHGEVTSPQVDIFDREAVFIDTVLTPIRQRHPELKVVLEHISTSQAVDFVRAAGPQVAATITPQHIRYNRNELFRGGLRPHAWCLPVLKAEAHRAAVLAAATSGEPCFFLGTDSAPHARHTKETACGCAGIFSAPVALELYADSFEQAGALDRLEGFASHFGADFYGLPRHQQRVTLQRQPQNVPSSLPLGEAEVIPMLAGESLGWRFAGAMA